MTSIFERGLGDDFGRLHPMLRRRFGMGLDAGYGCVGRGVMSQIRVGAPWVRPFLEFGRQRNILVPRAGTGVPFEISNFPYRDPLGRETITFVREFRFPGRDEPDRFDATMIWGGTGVVDYLGTHQHLATDLRMRVTDRGALVITSGEQRFYAGPLGFRFPAGLTGRAVVRERFDDTTGRFRINVSVHNPVFGLLEGYEGSFDCEFVDADDAPHRLKPVFHEARR